MRVLRRRAEKDQRTSEYFNFKQFKLLFNLSDMSKYWSIFKIGWQKVVEYRSQMLGHMILGIISFFALYFIWGAVFADRQTFGGYTFSAMMSYVLMARFLHFANRGNVGREIGNEIKNGSLSIYLMKPISYLKWWFVILLSERIYEMFLRGSITFLLIIVFSKLFTFPGWNNLLLFFIFLPIAIVVNFLINILIAVIAFWTTDVRLFRSTIMMVIEFFGGMVVPVDLMPGVLRKICRYLPFQFTGYFPIKVYQGMGSREIVNGLLLIFFWIILFLFLLKILWKKGLGKYEAIGQ